MTFGRWARRCGRKWQQPFDLAQGPLLRFKLLQLGPQNHVLLSTFHHIVSDGWSEGIFNQEFASISVSRSLVAWFGDIRNPEKTRRRLHDQPYSLALKRTQVLAVSQAL